MALSRLTDWNDGDVLFSATLEAEFDNIYNHALSLISPLTGNLAAGGFILTGLGLGTVSVPSIGFAGAASTGVYSTGAGNVDITATATRGLNVSTTAVDLRPGNTRALLANTTASAVNYIDVTPAITGAGPIILAAGSDTNVELKLRSQAAAAILLQPGATTSLSVNRVASAVNYVALSGSVASGSGVIIDAEGSDPDISVNHDTKGAGVHIFKVGAVEKYRINAYSRTTSWVAVTATQTATQSNTTLENVTDLVFPIEASTQYLVRGYLHFLGANTTHDIKMGWTYPTSCDIKWGPNWQSAALYANIKSYWTAYASGDAQTPDALLEETDTVSAGSGVVTHGAIITAMVTNSTNAGNLQFQFSQNASHASDLKILKGSCLEIIKLQ